jgi:hypothetical protein
VGTVRILYRADTISLRAAVLPIYTLGAPNMKEEEHTNVMSVHSRQTPNVSEKITHNTGCSCVFTIYFLTVKINVTRKEEGK